MAIRPPAFHRKIRGRPWAGASLDGPVLIKVPGMIAVVIGRNEGVRLAPSLESVEASGLQMVYSDSRIE